MDMSDLLSNTARVGSAILVYGLWQGALIAFITWGALQIFKSVNATTRYAVWSLALLAILIVPVATTLSRVSIEKPAAVAHERMQEAIAPLKAAAAPSKIVAAPITPVHQITTAAPFPWDNIRANVESLIPRAYAFCVSLPVAFFGVLFGLWF